MRASNRHAKDVTSLRFTGLLGLCADSEYSLGGDGAMLWIWISQHLKVVLAGLSRHLSQVAGLPT